MTCNWTKCKISSLGTVITGKTPPTSDADNYGGDILFLTPSDDMSLKRVYSTRRTLSLLGLSKVKNCLLPPKAVCISCIGSDLGKVVMTTCNTVTNQQINSIIVNKELFDPDFIFYSLKILGKRLNYLSKTSTAVPIINKASFCNETILVPPLTTQKRIAQILSDLDTKIENNNRINGCLEAQVKGYYNELIVNRDYPEGSISDIADITMGQSPKGKSMNETKKGSVFFQGRGEFGSRFPTIRLYTTEPTRFAKAGDTLISVRAPVGDLNIAHEDCCIGRGLASIHAKNGYRSFVYYTLTAAKEELNIFNGQGTVFGSINRDNLKNLKIKIPPSEVIKQFESLVEPIDKQILANEDEVRRLSAIRDALLPKLMSGEIDVDSIRLDQ